MSLNVIRQIVSCGFYSIAKGRAVARSLKMRVSHMYTFRWQTKHWECTVVWKPWGVSTCERKACMMTSCEEIQWPTVLSNRRCNADMFDCEIIKAVSFLGGRQALLPRCLSMEIHKVVQLLHPSSDTALYSETCSPFSRFSLVSLF